jgi:hypothetical protein
MPTVSLYDTHNNAHRKARLEAHLRERPRTLFSSKLLFFIELSSVRGGLGKCEEVRCWLPPRDSNPDRASQSR